VGLFNKLYQLFNFVMQPGEILALPSSLLQTKAQTHPHTIETQQNEFLLPRIAVNFPLSPSYFLN
jgi:hypothetical protein